MKCLKCSSNVPSSYKVCPYCGNDLENQQSYNNDLNFGNIDENVYDENKFEIKTFIKEKRNKKIVIGGIALIVIAFLIILLLISSTFKKEKIVEYSYINNIIKKIDKRIDWFFNEDKMQRSGDYRLLYKNNNSQYEINGEFSFDLENKIFDINGTFKDPRENEGGLILDYENLTFDSLIKDDNLYLYSKQIFDSYLNVPLNLSGYMNAKYDIFALKTGIIDALTESFANLKYTTENSKTEIKGNKIDVYKTTLKMDSDNYEAFCNTFYEALINDGDYINQLARIKELRSVDIENELKKLMNSIYERVDSSILIGKEIILYHKKNNLYKVEIKDNKKDEYIIILFEDNSYNIKYSKNKKTYDINFSRSEKDLNNGKEIIYSITCDSDDANQDLELTLNVDKKAKNKEYNDILSTNYNELPEEVKNSLIEKIKVSLTTFE